MSHLSILRKAEKDNLNRVLILEDDLNFVENFPNRVNAILDTLSRSDWNIFYGGHHLPVSVTNYLNKDISTLSPNSEVLTAHFIAFQHSTTIKKISNYLGLINSRKNGDLRGGPMHVDGAYSWFKKQFPETKTVVAYPVLGYQRSSRTDIHDLNWYDKLFFVKHLISGLRKLKNNTQENKTF